MSDETTATAAVSPATTDARFAAIVERHNGELWRFLVGLTGSSDQASDLLQDVFSDAWRAVLRGAPPFTGGSGDNDDIRRWLYHAAYCRAISARRRLRRIAWDSLDALAPPSEADLARLPSFEDAVAEGDAMRAALARLSREDAACLILMVVHRFTAAETAAILGAPAQGVAKRLSRAKRRLLAAYLAEDAHSQEAEHR